MRFALMMPLRATKRYDEWIGDGHLADVAVLIEEAGFDAVVTTEHPFPDDAFVAQGGHHTFDPFVALSFMAAATTRIKLLTGILVAGYRNPYMAAKALASLDKLSGGRVVAGMAAGYLKSEFEVLGAEWEHRGALFDACLDAMRAAWTGATVDVDGPYPAHGHTQLPPPAQAGGPPVWIGGNSPAARRRAATKGQGWMPLPVPAGLAQITKTQPLESFEDLSVLIADVQRRRREFGGEPLEICFLPFGDLRDFDAWTTRLARELHAYEDVGVTWLAIEPRARSLPEFRDSVSRLADTVVSAR